MAFYAFHWTKRAYILTVLSFVLLVITAKHREYFCCKEKPLSNFEKFRIWLGFLDKPKPCPGDEDLYTMANEMGVSAVAALSDRVPFRKVDAETQQIPPKYKYFFVRNAYEQRKIILVMREGDLLEEIFVYSPETRKMECVCCFRKGSR